MGCAPCGVGFKRAGGESSFPGSCDHPRAASNVAIIMMSAAATASRRARQKRAAIRDLPAPGCGPDAKMEREYKDGLAPSARGKRLLAARRGSGVDCGEIAQ